uniref:Uncharacterized protein n=1 Tax=Anopheles merus TaxID=30066 RepID=A0A182VNM3_ANOME
MSNVVCVPSVGLKRMMGCVLHRVLEQPRSFAGSLTDLYYFLGPGTYRRLMKTNDQARGRLARTPKRDRRDRPLPIIRAYGASQFSLRQCATSKRVAASTVPSIGLENAFENRSSNNTARLGGSSSTFFWALLLLRCVSVAC